MWLIFSTIDVCFEVSQNTGHFEALQKYSVLAVDGHKAPLLDHFKEGESLFYLVPQKMGS